MLDTFNVFPLDAIANSDIYTTARTLVATIVS